MHKADGFGRAEQPHIQRMIVSQKASVQDSLGASMFPSTSLISEEGDEEVFQAGKLQEDELRTQRQAHAR